MQKKQLAKEFLFLNLGTLLVAIGIHFFKFPNNFTTGGVTGIAVLLTALFPSISSAVFSNIFNVFFFLLGVAVLKRGFGLRTAYCALLFSALLALFDHFFPLAEPLTDQKMLELFFAVIFPSIGSAILFNLQGSTGGTEILALILKKHTEMDIGYALMCTDVLVALSSLFIFDAETGLYSLLGLILKSALVDNVAESLARKKSFTVVTNNPSIACEFITQRLKRGATFWQAEGAYTHESKYVVLAALSRSQAVALRRHLKEKDPGAFVLIENSSEIFGRGFTRI